MSRIFINYRRGDTAISASRLYEWLSERYGDEQVFMELVQSYRASMLWVAQRYVRDRATAEDVVQETWLAVLDGLPRFEGRASLRTWTFAILANRARSRAVRDWRTIPWSQLAGGAAGSTVDPDRFQGSDDPFPGHWTTAGAPRRWQHQPEDASLAGEARAEIGNGRPPTASAPAAPPPSQPALAAEFAKWNWGAFLLGPIWGLAHGVNRALLTLVPLYGLYEWVMLGRNGNRLAWEARKWDSVESFHKTQRKWATWAIVADIVLLIIISASSSG